MGWEDEFKFFEMPEIFKDMPCLFCDKNDPPCDMIIQDNLPGGGMAATHKTCFDEWLKCGDDDEQTPPEVE